MWNIISDILKSPSGSFAFVLGFLFLCGWVIYKITKAATEWDSKKSGIDKLETKVEKITEDLQYIKATLNAMKNTSHGAFTESHSPVSLTPLGKITASQMKIAERISANGEKIFSVIDSSVREKNAYDIQQFCIETATVALDRFFSEQDMRDLKSFAFNAGRDLAAYGSMIGVMIRDEYFKKRGIPIDEVDLNDPEKTA